MATSITEFVLKVANAPGTLAPILELLASKGLNIEAFAAVVSDSKSSIHLFTNDALSTNELLKKEGIKFEMKEMFDIGIRDRPGELAKITRALANAGVNITTIYITMKQTVVIGVDNTVAAAKIFQKMAL